MGRHVDPFEMNSTQLVRTIRLSNDLDMRDRVHNLRSYPNCFSGSDLVKYFVRRFGLTKAQAIRLGRQLLAKDLIRHVTGEHDFEDKSLFYSFNEEQVPKKQSPISNAAAIDIAQEMRQTNGVNVGMRRRWFVNYPDCFRGKEVVDWLCEATGVSRAGALQIGEAMLANNRIRHVLDVQPFRDDGHLFRFV
jgi:7-cyano-7-deazaguanine synthase in queuosine biosynthesis